MGNIRTTTVQFLPLNTAYLLLYSTVLYKLSDPVARCTLQPPPALVHSSCIPYSYYCGSNLCHFRQKSTPRDVASIVDYKVLVLFTFLASTVGGSRPKTPDMFIVHTMA